jgi:hypothetical protein
MPAEMISILDGSTFAVSNRAGDMDAGPDQPHGFFYKDTRHLSRWVLTVNGVAPAALSTDSVEYYFAQFFLAPPTGTIYRDPSLSLIRRRLIGDGFVEEVTPSALPTSSLAMSRKQCSSLQTGKIFATVPSRWYSCLQAQAKRRPSRLPLRDRP